MATKSDRLGDLEEKFLELDREIRSAKTIVKVSVGWAAAFSAFVLAILGYSAWVDIPNKVKASLSTQSVAKAEQEAQDYAKQAQTSVTKINQQLVAAENAVDVIRRHGLSELPIGTIVAWDKPDENAPPLPPGWVECDGSQVADITSPYAGKFLPDLNNSGRLLRGWTRARIQVGMSDDLMRATWEPRNQQRMQHEPREGPKNNDLTPRPKAGLESMTMIWIIKVNHTSTATSQPSS